MRTKKRRLEPYLFYDYRGIEAHLERMAERGWRLRRVTPLWWEYRRAEPEKRTFAVTYFSGASEFNPAPTENQRTFHDYCLDAGWELETEWAQIQVFSTAREDPVPVETDEAAKLNAINRAMWKNFLPANLVLLALGVFQIVFQVKGVLQNPVGELSSLANLFLGAAWLMLALCGIFTVGGYLCWYVRSRRSVAASGACIPGGAGLLGLSRTVLLLAWVSVLLATASICTMGLGWFGAVVLMRAVVLIALVFIIKSVLKKVGASGRINRTVTAAASVVLSVLLAGGMLWGVMGEVRSGWLGRSPAAVETVTMPNGSAYTWEIYRDPLPLTVEDLYPVGDTSYSRRWTLEESPLVSVGEARQYDPPGGGAPELSYTVVDVKLPVLFDLFLEGCIRDNFRGYDSNEELRRTDDPAWAADRVYQLFRQNKPIGDYIVCWGTRIISLRTDDALTAAQIALVTERLRG